MKTSDWALIQTLYECRNITRAAAQLYISQPTLTKRLRAIEEELGVVIALRGKRASPSRPRGSTWRSRPLSFSPSWTKSTVISPS